MRQVPPPSRRAGLAVGLVALLLSLGASCHPPPTLTSQGKQVWTALQIEQRVAELQNATIKAHETGDLPAKTHDIIVIATVKILRVLKTLPDGWQALIVATWNEMKTLLPSSWAANPILASSFAAVDVILGAYLGGAP